MTLEDQSSLTALRHVYLHIPFCAARCAYCDFASEVLVPTRQKGRVLQYLASLLTEIGFFQARGLGSVETIYIGGGTPTLLPADYLAELVRVLGGGLEVTVEANPETVSENLLVSLIECGVNRISIGVQSFSSDCRAALGRRVTDEAIRKACSLISGSGFSTWNLDLIFGIPGQTWESCAADILQATATGVPHISLYDLSYTPRYEQYLAKRIGLGAAVAARKFAERYYRRAVHLLEQAGYIRYEVSNFAKPGHECQHNLAYWRGHDYLGIGSAAVSTVGEVRWTNVRFASEYVARWAQAETGESRGQGVLPPSAETVEVLDRQTRLYERAMLGLRTREGIPIADFEEVLDQAWVQRLLERGLLISRCGTLSLSAGGLDVCNAVLSAILVPPAAS